MKKQLIGLLLLISFGANAQGFTLYASSVNFANSADFVIGSAGYSAGTTYLLFVTTTSGAVPTDNPTITSGSLVLTKIGTVTGSASRIILYTFTPSSSTTTGITLHYAETQSFQLYAMYQTPSVGPYKSVRYATGGATGADPLITMPSTGVSLTVGYFFNNRNPFAGTAESGWTEDFDVGTASTIGHAGYHRNVTQDETVQVTATSSTWIGIAIQFTARRIIIE